jgi:ankyrin repeat protein
VPTTSNTTVPLMALFRAIADGDDPTVARLLKASPELASAAIATGATRQESTDYFLVGVMHHVYTGDTALHVAAAGHRLEMVDGLLARGAAAEARNRRGAQPLHLAAAGNPTAPRWNPRDQVGTIRRSIEAGADPDATDKERATPLHKAVRTRCAAAAEALLSLGADPRRKNDGGSTPLHLAVQGTGRGGSGDPAAREQQETIIRLLLRHGARPSDQNGRGRTVLDSATEDRVRALLRG